MNRLGPILLLALVACGDPAVFRPAKNVTPSAPTKTAYRVKESSCDSIGFVIQAESIDDLAATAASHGATQYKILDDFG